MKPVSLLFALLCLALPCFSADLVIAENKSSNYQIVFPDELASQHLLQYVSLGAELIRVGIKNASGADVPLVRESQKAADKPAIYVGDTKALAAAGLSAKDFAKWEHAIAVKGNDIFIYGADWPNPFKNNSSWILYYAVGSLRASCVFAEKFLNTRVMGMTRSAQGMTDGVRTLPKETITVPEDFSYRVKPRFLSSDSDLGGMLYNVANNHLFDCGAAYDVHYHVRAIPQDKYYDKHPEYFALIKGERYKFNPTVYNHGEHSQYCLSNPEVQELIYQDALARADKGYKVVEFGQADGFLGCECENCKKMYGTDDWTEKLWCLHRDLSARLKAERPDVQVAIAAYGPTRRPPKSFKKFPVPMIIDVGGITPDLRKEWEGYNVVGMVAWIYPFGAFQASGFSPAASFAKLQKDKKFYHTTPVTTIYHCGISNASSIAGPWIYAWGRWDLDPEESVDTILHDYCLYSFGEKAAPYFEKFYKLMDSRMEKYPNPINLDVTTFDIKDTTLAVGIWSARYPEDVVAELTSLFEKAVSLCDEKNSMLPGLKIEFEYLRLTANVCNARKKWLETKAREDRVAIADAVEARTRFIESLPVKDDYIMAPGFKLVQPGLLKLGGTMYGRFRDVFEEDLEKLRK